LYFGRFSAVHIGGLPSNQTTLFESQMIQYTQEFGDGHLTLLSKERTMILTRMAILLHLLRCKLNLHSDAPHY